MIKAKSPFSLATFSLSENPSENVRCVYVLADVTATSLCAQITRNRSSPDAIGEFFPLKQAL
jgi:hypothetical protein